MTVPDADPNANPETPVRRRPFPQLTPLQWLEVAVLAAVLVAITPALVRRLGPPNVPDASSLMTALPLTDSIAADLFANPIWGTIRGDGESLVPDARGIRLGAAIASFELRQRLGDSATASSAMEVVSLAETFSGGSVAANAYRVLAAGSPTSSDADDAAELAEKVAGARIVRLGAWLQGARFAAAAGDSAWFAGNVPATVVRAAITMDDRADTEAAARQFERIARQRPHDFVALGTAADELLRLLGTR
jgi:hypothetical protein